MNNESNEASVRKRNIVCEIYRGYTLGSEGAYDARLLEATLEVINASLADHSKVLVKRVDFHAPQNITPEKSKEAMGNVMAEIMRNLNRPRTRGVEKSRPALGARYIMVPEKNKAENPHNHCIIAMNGNLVQKGYYPMQEIKNIVERKLGNAALVHECRNGEWLLHRGNEDELAEVVRATSYIAKVRTKENNKGREVMRSQLNRKR